LFGEKRRFRAAHSRQVWTSDTSPHGYPLVSTRETALKVRNLRRDRRLWLCTAGRILWTLDPVTTLSHSGLDIPAGISIVGYDDSPIASLSFIELTTVHKDAALMAELAVQAQNASTTNAPDVATPS
jgi:hypothetical protein